MRNRCLDRQQQCSVTSSVLEINVYELRDHMQWGWEKHLGWALKAGLMDQHVQRPRGGQGEAGDVGLAFCRSC